MKPSSRSNADPLERQIESALRPGEFIYDRACFAFVGGLAQVANGIKELIATEPVRAVVLCETFLAGCHAKADQLDDSSGSFGTFVKDLIWSWITARQAGGADPDETADMLLRWMDDDPYSFCYEIEKVVSTALDEAGCAAFEKQIRARFDATSEDPVSWPYRRLSAVLRAIYLAQRNVPAYIEHAKRTGITPEDCLTIVKLLAATEPSAALIWAERGIAIEREQRYAAGEACCLDDLRRELLVRMGRGDEALQSAWKSFEKHPSVCRYEDLMKFAPEAERAAWHERAMEAAKGADLRSQIDLFVETNEAALLADLLRGVADKALEEVSHYSTEPAAEELEESHPELAARLWRAQGMRIADARKSKYYEAALDNFERARDCYLRAGLSADWELTVRHVSAAHFRKSGFIGEFREVAVGAKRSERPSFLDCAKQRWRERLGL